jgi:predicted exporter
MDKRKKVMVISSVCILLLAAVLVTIQLWPAKPPELPTRPADSYLASVQPQMAEHWLKWERVTWEVAPDGQSLTFKGAVASQADLDLLNSILAKGTPALKPTMEVAVRR